MPIHPPGTIENSLPEEKCIGPVDPLTLPNEAMEVTPDQKRVDEARANMPKLGAMINLYDFEVSFCKGTFSLTMRHRPDNLVGRRMGRNGGLA